MAIKKVRGAESGTEFLVSQIRDSSAYARMRMEPLLTDSDEIVVPVRSKQSPHFRRIGKPGGFSAAHRNPPSQKHRQTIGELHQRLMQQGNKLEFITYVFENNKQVLIGESKGKSKCASQVLFKPGGLSEYIWYTESRIRFDDGVYIQPDLSGRDTKTMAPGPSNPAIIIEVIDSHPPEPETFARLMRLSMCAHQVYFFFITSSRPYNSQYMNSIRSGDPRASFRFTHALIGGELVVNGEILGIATDGFDLRCAKALAEIEQVVLNKPDYPA